MHRPFCLWDDEMANRPPPAPARSLSSHYLTRIISQSWSERERERAVQKIPPSLFLSAALQINPIWRFLVLAGLPLRPSVGFSLASLHAGLLGAEEMQWRMNALQ